MVAETAALPAYKRARRESILSAAERLVERRSYDDVQMKDIAEEAGVALATLYTYFGSKELLYVEVLERWASWDGLPSPDGLRAKVGLIIDSVEQRPHLFLVEFVLQSSTDEVVQARRQTWSDAGAQWLVGGTRGRSRKATHQATIVWAVINHVLVRATAGRMTFGEARATVAELLDLVGAATAGT